MGAAQRAHTAETHATPISMRVVEAVAEREGTDSTALAEPLYDAIDPDALDSLFDGPGDRRGRVTFRFHGYRVTVRSDGEIAVADRR